MMSAGPHVAHVDTHVHLLGGTHTHTHTRTNKQAQADWNLKCVKMCKTATSASNLLLHFNCIGGVLSLEMYKQSLNLSGQCKKCILKWQSNIAWQMAGHNFLLVCVFDEFQPDTPIHHIANRSEIAAAGGSNDLLWFAKVSKVDYGQNVCFVFLISCICLQSLDNKCFALIICRRKKKPQVTKTLSAEKPFVKSSFIFIFFAIYNW